MAAMSRRPSVLPKTAMRRWPFSRRIWFGPSASCTSATMRSGTCPVGVAMSRSPRPVVERSWSERRMTTSKRRLPSTICETVRPFDIVSRACVTRRRRQAVEGSPLVIDIDAELRDAHLLLDLQVDEALDRRQLLAQCLRQGAQGVRSSP